MKTRRIAMVIGAFSIALATLSPLAAQAEEPTLAEVEEIVTYDSNERWVDSDGYVRLPRAELENLAKTQTPGEVEALLKLEIPLNLLVDTDTGAHLAAAVAEKVSPGALMPFALTPTGCGTPGHAFSNRYVGSRALTTCFEGTGSLFISLPNTYYLNAGWTSTTWFPPAPQTGIWVTAFSSVTLSSNLNVVEVFRG